MFVDPDNEKGRSIADRFWPKVKKTDGCWLWTATGNRYGGFRVKGTLLRAHRVSWELAFGPVPDGMLVLHHCDVPLCVRPDHLFLGTQADNMADMASKGRRVIVHRGPNKRR